VVEDSQNRRHFGRRTAFKAATIAQSGGQRLAATVLDISEAGARIKTAKPELVEKEFYLEIGADDFVIKCRTLHIHQTYVGVKFIGSPKRLSWLSRTAES
jgi:hypothetical protein